MKSFLNRAIVWVRGILFFQDFRNLGTEERFTKIYQKHWWGRGTKSVSGTGSLEENTENLRKELHDFLLKYDVNTFLDAPCGDWNWLQTIKFPETVQYIGADIVKDLVEKNERDYSSDKITFQHLDITKDSLPKVDMWMCRDCLLHLSQELVFLVLENFVSSKSKYFLASCHPDAKFNKNIVTGRNAPINLLKPPYSLPDPIDQIVDYKPPRLRKHLMLWTHQQIKEVVEQRL